MSRWLCGPALITSLSLNLHILHVGFLPQSQTCSLGRIETLSELICPGVPVPFTLCRLQSSYIRIDDVMQRTGLLSIGFWLLLPLKIKWSVLVSPHHELQPQCGHIFPSPIVSFEGFRCLKMWEYPEKYIILCNRLFSPLFCFFFF